MTIASTQEDDAGIKTAGIKMSRNGGEKCPYCAKTCGNSGSLKNHIRYKHKEELEKSVAQTNVVEVENALVDEETIFSDVHPIAKPTAPIRKSARRRSISSHKSKSSPGFQSNFM